MYHGRPPRPSKRVPGDRVFPCWGTASLSFAVRELPSLHCVRGLESGASVPDPNSWLILHLGCFRSTHGEPESSKEPLVRSRRLYLTIPFVFASLRAPGEGCLEYETWWLAFASAFALLQCSHCVLQDDI